MTKNEIKLKNDLLYGINANKKAVVDIALNHIQSARDYLLPVDFDIANALLEIMRQLQKKHDIKFKWDDEE